MDKDSAEITPKQRTVPEIKQEIQTETDVPEASGIRTLTKKGQQMHSEKRNEFLEASIGHGVVSI